MFLNEAVYEERQRQKIVEWPDAVAGELAELDDRFREPGIRGTGSVLVDSSFEFV
jgi:hypothetical protein